jgi:hypothetical protein
VPPSDAGLYFREGVRTISDETFTRILAAADAQDPALGRRRQEAGLPFASPDLARNVDEVAIELAITHLKKNQPHDRVRQMPHNNPGYDIRIETEAGPPKYVEVKGTSRALPHFFMSEGERLFSHDHGPSYTLIVVYAIDVEQRTGELMVRDGPIDERGDVTLRAVTWEGVVSM